MIFCQSVSGVWVVTILTGAGDIETLTATYLIEFLPTFRGDGESETSSLHLLMLTYILVLRDGGHTKNIILTYLPLCALKGVGGRIKGGGGVMAVNFSLGGSLHPLHVLLPYGPNCACSHPSHTLMQFAAGHVSSCLLTSTHVLHICLDSHIIISPILSSLHWYIIDNILYNS